jgi:hypothetical protein
MTRPPCPVCPDPNACTCGTAYRWAKRRGVLLPGDGKGSLCGDQRPSTEQRESVAQGLAQAVEVGGALASFRAQARAQRLAETSSRTIAEKLEFYIQVLELSLVKGRDEHQIARRFGRESHSFTAERLAEFREEALTLYRESGERRFCMRPRCGKIVERIASTGRRALYCTDRCAHAHAQAMYEARKRVRFCHVSVMGKDCQSAPPTRQD